MVTPHPSASCHVEKREFHFADGSCTTVVDQFENTEAQSQYLADKAQFDGRVYGSQ